MRNSNLPIAPQIVRLINAMRRLPGIGQKNAERLTYYLVKMPREDALDLAEAILSVKDDITLCEMCMNISEARLCTICDSDGRDGTLVCVVQQPLDIMALEKTGSYKGLYHVLHGALSPIRGIGPSEIKIQELLNRVVTGSASEVIIATNPNLEGEATALYIQSKLATMDVKVTKLGRGLPSGSDLEYADDSTLLYALETRVEMPLQHNR